MDDFKNHKAAHVTVQTEQTETRICGRVLLLSRIVCPRPALRPGFDGGQSTKKRSRC